MVSTPQGPKYHGYIDQGIFHREVGSRDLMRIFNAWSLHPTALDQIQKEGVKHLFYKDVDAKKEYKILVEDVVKNGFKKSFAGGETVYIPLKFWNKAPDNQQKLL